MLAVALVLAAGTVQAQSGESAFHVGQTVAARWAGTSWYIATLDSVEGEKYSVTYGDNSKGTLARGDLLPMCDAAELAVNDRVMAVWSGAKMYGGVLTAKGAGGYTVKWDDGSAPSEVAVGKIAKLPGDKPAEFGARSIGDPGQRAKSAPSDRRSNRTPRPSASPVAPTGVKDPSAKVWTYVAPDDAMLDFAASSRALNPW